MVHIRGARQENRAYEAEAILEDKTQEMHKCF